MPLTRPLMFQSLKRIPMKNTLFAAALITTLFAAPAAWAGEGGSCHFHGKKPAAEAAVSDCAQQRRDALVKAGKLDASWQTVQQDKLELIDGKKGKEWKASFKNPAVADADKQTLYIFFSQPGNFIGANHTGQ
jgi:hypothetical protein